MTAEPLAVPIRFTPLFVPLAWLTGMWPRLSRVTVGDDVVQVTMGWAFRATLPVSSVSSVREVPSPWWLGVGVHGFGGTWAVNGSLRGSVELRLASPQRARVLGVPVRLQRLFVSVTAPAVLVDGVGQAQRRLLPT